MGTPTPIEVAWSTPRGELVARVPSEPELEAHVEALAAAYNDPHNAALLGHEALLTTDDVRAHYAGVRAGGGHPFVLLRDGALAGDGDLRDVVNRACEFAFLIGAPSAQGQGLGTAFATMLHAFAFTRLPVDRIYAAIVPGNQASRRVFDKLGYAVDDSPTAKLYADDVDLVMSVARTPFLRQHADALREIRIRDGAGDEDAAR